MRLDLKWPFTVAYLTLTIVTVIFMFISFPLGGYTIFNPVLSNRSSIYEEAKAVYFFAIGIPFVIPTNMSAAELFIMVWLVYLVFFVMAVAPRFPIRNVASKIKNLGPNAVFHNTITSVATIFSALVLVITVIEALQKRAGVQTGELKGDPLLVFLSVTLAPLREEFGFRLTIIGLFASLILLLRGGRVDALKALWNPAKYLRLREAQGLRTSEKLLIYSSLVFSGLFFGVAHLLYGAGTWEIGKITTASLAGLVLGWVYVFYGMLGAVLLHWSFNYFSSAYYYFEQISGFKILSNLVDISIAAAGIPTLVFFALRVTERLASKKAFT